jgi:hypothetical protein
MPVNRDQFRVLADAEDSDQRSCKVRVEPYAEEHRERVEIEEPDVEPHQQNGRDGQSPEMTDKSLPFVRRAIYLQVFESFDGANDGRADPRDKSCAQLIDTSNLSSAREPPGGGAGGLAKQRATHRITEALQMSNKRELQADVLIVATPKLDLPPTCPASTEHGSLLMRRTVRLSPCIAQSVRDSLVFCWCFGVLGC